MPDTDTLPPLDDAARAAVMVMLLEDDQAARILARLEPQELRLLGEKMCALGEIGPDVIAHAIAGFVAALGGARALHLMPYHSFGEGKYRLLERNYAFAGAPSMRPEELVGVADRLGKKHSLTIRIGG